MRLVVQELVAGYGGKPVLHDVTATAGEGRITAVIGPNAAGKTTLLRCLIGAMRPISGAVLLDDFDVHQMSTAVRAQHIAYVAQRAEVSTSFVVRQVVELGRYALGRSPDRVEQAMRDADIESLAARRFSELSVGQQQRVMLARALAQVADDGVLILDEPMAGMDPRHAIGTAGIIRRCAARGIAVLVTMHDLTMTARLAHDVWMLADGRLVGAGPMVEVMSDEHLRRTFGIGIERIEAASGTVILPTDRTQSSDRT